MKVIGFVFARGGSKGCPGKNIREIAGKPLLAHAIEKARASTLIDQVIVSTDSDEIARVALLHGAMVLIRPAHLCSDQAAEWKSWQHALKRIECDVFVSIPTTCPLRSVEDINKTIMCVAHFNSDMAFTVKHSKEFIYSEGVRPPARRQELPITYAVVGSCYAAKRDFVLDHESMWDTNNLSTVLVPDDRALDIDTEFDFKIAKLLMESA